MFSLGDKRRDQQQEGESGKLRRRHCFVSYCWQRERLGSEAAKMERSSAVERQDEVEATKELK